MDVADQADKEQAMQLKAALQHCHRDTPNAIANGECLFCGEPLSNSRRWCGVECRDAWQREFEQ